MFNNPTKSACIDLIVTYGNHSNIQVTMVIETGLSGFEEDDCYSYEKMFEKRSCLRNKVLNTKSDIDRKAHNNGTTLSVS